MDHLTPAQQNSLSSSSKDEILPVFNIGECVKLLKDIKNDGTYAFSKVGDVIIKAGATGYVRHVGDFLQTIRIYEVDFLNEGLVIGCREFELESIDDGFKDDVEAELSFMKAHRKEKYQS